MIFQDRTQAGIELAESLAKFRDRDVVVYALPRGGVVVGVEVASYLQAPFGLIIPRKIGHPMEPEYAIGAVTETGHPVWNESELGFTEPGWRNHEVALARQEAKRRRMNYQGHRASTDSGGKVAIIVDDGIATGLTMVAAVKEVLGQRPQMVVVAVPVAPGAAATQLRPFVDELVVLVVPTGSFGAVGEYYETFPQVEDDEVRAYLEAYQAGITVPVDLAALRMVLANVHQYPTTSRELAARAKRMRAPGNVVDFFESIPKDIEFKDKADVVRRTEAAAILEEEEVDQPDETLRSYD
jgi:predicted phosphoribosyltransferase